MSKWIPALVAGLLGVAGLTHWASVIGWGAPQPAKKPVSVREDSRGGYTYFHHHRRTFVGGGLRGGK